MRAPTSRSLYPLTGTARAFGAVRPPGFPARFPHLVCPWLTSARDIPARRRAASPEFGTPRRSPEVSSTAVRARPPDLRFAPLMDMGFAPDAHASYPVFVHRLARLLPASFRRAFAGPPLRVAEWRRGIAPRRSHRTGRKPRDLSGSCHPRRPAGLPPSPTGSSRCRLALRRGVGDPPPSLPGRYPSSSLLRGGPSLVSASVLSASRDHRLGLFPSHRRQGSQVPHASPNESHAA